MTQCDARYRDDDRQWRPCQAVATDLLVVNDIAFNYCATHTEQFIAVLPAGSWQREPLRG